MSYSFPKNSPNGEEVILENGVTYKYNSIKKSWEILDSEEHMGYVKKVDGDSMEGPLSIKQQKGTENLRATNRIHTLGVFSGSDSSALRLGTTRDRVYVGHDDTSFNGPIKVEEIQEKTVGGGIKIANRVILNTEGVKEDEAVTKKYVDDQVSSAGATLHTLTTKGTTYRFSNGLDAPTDTSFRTESINVEYNTKYHFKKLWTSSGYDAFLKNYKPTLSTTLEIYLRGVLMVKTTIKNYAASSRSNQSVMFDVSGSGPSVHNYGSLSSNSYYQIILTDMVEG